MGRKKVAGNVQMGPGTASLILIFVMLALSILAMLTLINAKNDEQTSLRSARVTEAIYELEAQSQRVYALVLESIEELDADGKQKPSQLCTAVAQRVNERNTEGNWTLAAQQDTLSWENTDGERTFACVLRLTGDKEKPAEWVLHQMTAKIAEGEDEWSF